MSVDRIHFTPARREDSTTSADRIPPFPSRTWYLAVEFQLHLVVPPLALLYFKHRRCGIAAAGILALACLVSLVSTLLTRTDMTLCVGEEEGPFGTFIANKPWTRGLPYFLGILLAFAHHRFGGPVRCVDARKPRVWLRILLLLVFAASVAGAIYGTAGMHDLSGSLIGSCQWGTASTAGYFIASRVTWALAVFLVVYACVLAWSRLLVRVLAHGWFRIPARLLRSVYLLHPIFIIYVVYTQDARPIFTTTLLVQVRLLPVDRVLESSTRAAPLVRVKAKFTVKNAVGPSLDSIRRF